VSHSLIPQPLPTSTLGNQQQFVADLCVAQQLLLKSAVENQRHQTAVQDSRSRAAQSSPFKVGMYVLVNHPNNTKPTKLSPRWRGPFVITAVDGPYVVIKSLIDDYEGKLHSARCKEFHLSAGTDPKALAALDSDEYFIDTITAHSPISLTGPKKLWKFQVKWVGYEELEWVDYMNIRNTAAYETYMQQHGG